MKRIFLSLVLASAFSAAYSQASFGVHANGIMANAKETEDDQDVESKYRFSWKAGIVATLPLTDKFSFMPQLNVVNKWYKIDQSETFSMEGQELTFSLKMQDLNCL